jgi:hypothetical protein
MEKLLNVPVRTTLAVLILTVSAFAQGDNPSGRWTAPLQRGDRSGVAVINLEVTGNHVTGTLSDPSGQTLQMENGVFEGGQLSFECFAREHGGWKRIRFFGQVTNDAITLHNESNSKQGVTMTFHKLKD